MRGTTEFAVGGAIALVAASVVAFMAWDGRAPHHKAERPKPVIIEPGRLYVCRSTDGENVYCGADDLIAVAAPTPDRPPAVSVTAECSITGGSHQTNRCGR